MRAMPVRYGHHLPGRFLSAISKLSPETGRTRPSSVMSFLFFLCGPLSKLFGSWELNRYTPHFVAHTMA